MEAIRRAKARNDYGPDPSLDLQAGAHLKVKSEKLFPPTFNEETGDFWGPTLSLVMEIIDDGTEEGDADGETFADRFELKIDEEFLDTLGIEEKALRNSRKADFTAEQIKSLKRLV
jgi:hypothetical protein